MSKRSREFKVTDIEKTPDLAKQQVSTYKVEKTPDLAKQQVSTYKVEKKSDLLKKQVSVYSYECDKLRRMVAESLRFYREHFGNVPVHSHRQ